jgi:hypothetical protein
MGAFQERAPIRHGHSLATGTATVKDLWYGRARAPPRHATDERLAADGCGVTVRRAGAVTARPSMRSEPSRMRHVDR